MVHAGTHVDLDDPGIQVFVDHEVVADHLKEALLASDGPLTTLDTPHDDALHLLLHHPPLLLADKFHKRLHLPHTLVDHRILVVLLDGVVSQVHELVVDVVQGIIVAAETQVTLLVEPYDGRVEVFDQHPLTDVEFATVYQQRVLDVLLDDELTVLTQAVIGNIV